MGERTEATIEASMGWVSKPTRRSVVVNCSATALDMRPIRRVSLYMVEE